MFRASGLPSLGRATITMPMSSFEGMFGFPRNCIFLGVSFLTSTLDFDALQLRQRNGRSKKVLRKEAHLNPRPITPIYSLLYYSSFHFLLHYPNITPTIPKPLTLNSFHFLFHPAAQTLNPEPNPKPYTLLTKHPKP